MITKSGIIISPNFYESDAMCTAKRGMDAYIPNTGTNSCIVVFGTVNYGSDANSTDVYRCILDLSYQGFDESNPNGTFNIWFQCAYDDFDGKRHWYGDVSFANAMNNQRSLKTVVLSNTSGNFVYDVSFRISDDYIQNYDHMYCHIRSDYSNGTGKLTINKGFIIPDKYYSGDRQSSKGHINSSFISTNNYIEI